MVLWLQAWPVHSFGSLFHTFSHLQGRFNTNVATRKPELCGGESQISPEDAGEVLPPLIFLGNYSGGRWEYKQIFFLLFL